MMKLSVAAETIKFNASQLKLLWFVAVYILLYFLKEI